MLRFPIRLALPLAIAFATTIVPRAAAAQERLSAQERRIVAYVDAHAEEAIALLERIVNINSGTMNPAGVRRVGGVLRAQLDSIGFQTRWIDLPDSLRRAGTSSRRERGRRGSASS